MKPRLVFVINSIGSGGAERVLDIILRGRPDWAEAYEIHLVLLDDEPAKRAMAPVDHTHVLDGRGSLARSIRQLHALLDRLKPDLVVSFLIRSNLAAACWRWRGAAAPVIVCERMHVTSHLAGRYRPMVARMQQLALRLGYRRADRVLAVSQGVADDLAQRFAVPRGQLAVVPNPYDRAAIMAAGQPEPEISVPARYMVAVGRMVAAKNFAGLIDAYAAAEPDIDLVILGEGPEHDALTEQVRRLGLEGRVHMPGYLANPLPVVARAQFLVSASRNEGFPNAIAEAMALGVPIVSTDCPSGPAELLVGSAHNAGEVVRAQAGLLVPIDDGKALAGGIALMAQDGALRARLREAGQKRIDDFPQAAIVAQYWEHFRQCLDGGC